MSIKIGVYRNTREKEAEPIQNDLLSSLAMAQALGKSFIDQNYYRQNEFSFQIPHKTHNIFPGKFISFTSDKLGLSGQLMKCKRYSIVCDYTGIRATITSVKYD